MSNEPHADHDHHHADPSIPAEPAPAPPPRPRVGCARCGYDIAGMRIGEPCPECGTMIQQFPSDSRGNSGMAITSMVLGIVSILGCAFYGILSIITGPLAIWFGVKAKRAVREGRASQSSTGMATAGFVCGIIGTTIGGAYLLFMVIFVGFAFFAASQSGGPRFLPTP